MSRIVMTGATGFLGTRLYRALRTRGYAVTVLARNADRAALTFPDAAGVYLWAPGVDGAWRTSLDGADAVINLAGESLGGQRWDEAYKRRLRDSRIRGTADLAGAIAHADVPPGVLLSASAVGYYGDTGDEWVDESAPPGEDFMAQLCVDWEAEAMRAKASGVRVVCFRTGVVLARDGGALPRLLTPFRLFAGGPLGSGRQWFPWVHVDDAVGIFMHALEHGTIGGAVNVVAPGIARNADFARQLGAAMHRPALLPVPAFALRLAVGEFAYALLEGQRATPSRALGTGYSFRQPELRPALDDVLAP